MYKMKINKIVKPEEGQTFTLAKHGQHVFENGELIFYDLENTTEEQIIEEIESGETEVVEEDITAEILKERERSREESRIDFQEKYQIRPGLWSVEAEAITPIEWPDELYYDTEVSTKLKKEIGQFFEKIELITKFKKSKRSYLLHSIPGVGKTALIRNISKKYQDDSTAFIRVSGVADFTQLHTMFKNEYHEDVKRIILVVEDIGGKTNEEMRISMDPQSLNFLDGDSYLFRVPTLVLCTTNFINDIGHTLVDRPGRFSKILRVAPPKIEDIYEIVKLYSGAELPEEGKEAFKQFEGVATPDHCIEAVIRSEIEEIELSESIRQVMEERQR